MAMFLGGPGYAQVVGLYIQVDVPRVFVQLGGGGRGAVSYTHLTLPTMPDV